MLLDLLWYWLYYHFVYAECLNIYMVFLINCATAFIAILQLSAWFIYYLLGEKDKIL